MPRVRIFSPRIDESFQVPIGRRSRSRCSAFDRKRMDYVVCTREGAHLIAVVELDDRTHDPQKDANRDAMLASAGIRTVRFPSHPRPSAMEIRAEVLGRRAA